MDANYNVSWWVWLVALLITLIAGYFAFIIILYWLKPAFYTASGEPEWWTAAWVILLTYVFAWIILWVISFLVNLFVGNGKRVVVNGGNGCPTKCDEMRMM